MRDIATAQLSGNLTRDVELRALPSGAEVASLRVAFTTRRRQGEQWVDKTNYMTVDVYGAQARACAQYLAKGARVFVDAELDWRDWTTQDGQQRETISLKARQVLFEGGRAQTASDPGNGTAPVGSEQAPAVSQAPAANRRPAAAPAGTGTATADDLPF
jgi:single-strand DNA-binding protein